MSRRKLGERHVRKLGKGVTSYFVTIPIEAIRDLGWRKSQKVVVEVDHRHGELVIKDWK